MDPEMTPTIQQRLSDLDENVRLAALAELLKPDGQPAQFVEDVAASLSHANEIVGQLAAVVLGQVAAQGEAGAHAVPALTRALDESHAKSVRVFAASGLASAGASAAPAIEPLCRAMTVPDPKLQFQAAFALSRIGLPAVPWLRRMLRASDPAVVAAAADALGWIGRPAKDSAEDLRSLLSSPDAKIRQSCDAAIEKVAGQPAKV